MPDAHGNDLTSFVERMGGSRSLRVEENLGCGFVRLRVEEAERRQAKHDIRCVEDIVIELLRNARDAGARRIFVATAREGDRRTIVMLDDGSGIPSELQERIFDARVTSKLESVHEDRWGVHGRGMALYSVRENADDARIVDSALGKGTAIRVATQIARVPEKADQSSWPHVGHDDAGDPILERGPHNIIRTCCEFVLEEHGTCEVYLGSPSDIVATIRSRVRPSVQGADLLFLAHLDELPILERFRVAADARELQEVSQACGLDISERTAQRIISGDISPIRSVYARLTKGATKAKRDVDLSKDRRGLRLSKEDTKEFSNMMERDFEHLADRYYLTLLESPKIRVSGNSIMVRFDFTDND